jgi:hypothetical protein
MHDPQILAFEINYPWWRYRPWPKNRTKNRDKSMLNFSWSQMSESEKQNRHQYWPEGYRSTFINVYHADPERDGSDDSCGWSYVRLTAKQRDILRNAAWHEAHCPHFLCCESKQWTGALCDAEALTRGLFILVNCVLGLGLSCDQICKYAAERVHIRDCGHAGDEFCFLPGYHTNNGADKPEYRQDHFTGILCSVARVILTDRRPWWKHPRWHLLHFGVRGSWVQWGYKIQCIPLQSLKRWLFSRCCRCGKGFNFGDSVCTDSWTGTGPRWFRSERNVYHDACEPHQERKEAQHDHLR